MSAKATRTPSSSANGMAKPLVLIVEDEIDLITTQLVGETGSAESAARLITLTGLGGSGKTRLAIEVAGRVASRFSGGVREEPSSASIASVEMAQATLASSFFMVKRTTIRLKS